jgi:hypothetical protein
VFQRTQDFPLGQHVPHSTIPTHHRLSDTSILILGICYQNRASKKFWLILPVRHYQRWTKANETLFLFRARKNKGKGKGKAISWQALTGPEGSRRLRLIDFKTIGTWSGKVVIPTHQPPLPPGNIPGTHFCQPQGHSAAERIEMKNSNDTIANRTRDLSAVPQPLRHRVPPQGRLIGII